MLRSARNCFQRSASPPISPLVSMPQPVCAISEKHSGHADVIHRTAKGVLYASAGQVLLFLISWGGGIFLSRLLSISDFGVYAIVSFLVLRASSLSDLG